MSDAQFIPAGDWQHIACIGEWPHEASGKVQIIDAAALASIVKNFKKIKAEKKNFAGLLVDQDHFSLEADQPSEAYGWLVDMEARADGLWGRIRWTDIGEQALVGGRYRYLSPVWLTSDCEPIEGDKVRPLKLQSVAVTNAPNFKDLTPLSNRAIAAKPKKNSAAKNEGARMDYKEILLRVLGLPEDASDEVIQAAIDERAAAAANEDDGAAKKVEEEKKELEEKLEQLEEKLEKIEEEKKEEEADKVLNRFAAVIKNRDGIRKALLRDLAGTKAMLESLKLEALPNRKDGKIPADSELVRGVEVSEAQAAAIANRAKEMRLADKSMTYVQAWQSAEAEIVNRK